MLRLYDQLPETPEQIEKHIAALSNLASAKDHQELFAHLYGCLSILDSKCASLLSFNSIIIAVFAIFMTSDLKLTGWIVVHLGMALILVSALCLLSVIWVHWSTTDHLSDLKQHSVTLLQVRRSRTIRYRLAWYFSVLSLLCLSTFIAGRFLARLP